jgi:heme-degrading monooxygenase HmoA
MYASIRRYRVVGSVQELAQKAEAGMAPILKQNPGFIAYYVVDGGDGHVASISVFESGDAAHRSNEQAAAWVKDNASGFLPDPPTITHGQVLVEVKQ